MSSDEEDIHDGEEEETEVTDLSNRYVVFLIRNCLLKVEIVWALFSCSFRTVFIMEYPSLDFYPHCFISYGLIF